jgi:hypothetical protein
MADRNDPRRLHMANVIMHSDLNMDRFSRPTGIFTTVDSCVAS